MALGNCMEFNINAIQGPNHEMIDAKFIIVSWYTIRYGL